MSQYNRIKPQSISSISENITLLEKFRMREKIGIKQVVTDAEFKQLKDIDP